MFSVTVSWKILELKQIENKDRSMQNCALRNVLWPQKMSSCLGAEKAENKDHPNIKVKCVRGFYFSCVYVLLYIFICIQYL